MVYKTTGWNRSYLTLIRTKTRIIAKLNLTLNKDDIKWTIKI